jgi:hypothetical protein
VAACHLKLEEWKECIKSATESIDELEKLDPSKKKQSPKSESDNDGEADKAEEEEEAEEEIISAGAVKSEDTSEAAQKAADIQRIRSKALLRRARARSEAGGWANLSGAEEDYKALSAMPNLSPQDRKVVLRQLQLLPPRVKEAQEREMADMMGKLKQLGNGILKPFGLSTDNFQMVKDETTGGYSMNFNQGGK